MKLRPGVSTAWNLPRRSTTHAVCWGTTLTDWNAKSTATTTSTSVKMRKPLTFIFSMTPYDV